MKLILLILIHLVFSITSYSEALQLAPLKINQDTTLRVGVLEPSTKYTKADVIYLHGFADRFDNHMPLFNLLADSGFRVISFDYPSHGETESKSINRYDFEDMFELVSQVDEFTLEDTGRPLYIIGWSTGGLIATRMAQSGFINQLTRNVSGIVLHAPGISVYPLVGDYGLVTEESLTNNPNPPHQGEIKPKSPLLKLGFSGILFYNSILSQYSDLPDNIPILTIVAGNDEDKYVDTRKVKEWVIQQKKNKAIISVMQCKNAKHEIDNEIEPIGHEVRLATLNFLVANTIRKSNPEFRAITVNSYCKLI